MNYTHTLAALKTRSEVTTGAGKDLAKCLNPLNGQYGFSESVYQFGLNNGFDWSTLFALPQKQVMRAIQFACAIVAGNRLYFDYTHARVLCAARLAGNYDLNTDAIIGLAAGIKSPTANYRGITSSAVNQLFAQSHKLTTVQTKVSNMTGRNGWAQVSGVTFAAPTVNHSIALNLEHQMVVKFFDLIDASTQNQIDAMIAKGNGEK